jgi:hypothetical protein
MLETHSHKGLPSKFLEPDRITRAIQGQSTVNKKPRLMYPRVLQARGATAGRLNTSRGSRIVEKVGGEVLDFRFWFALSRSRQGNTCGVGLVWVYLDPCTK